MKAAEGVGINGTENCPGYIIKCYKNTWRLNNFPTVNAIDFLFSTLHTTPFHYRETYFGA